MNDTTRTYPRTLAEAFPESPGPYFEQDRGLDGHDVLEIALVVLMVLLPVFFWLV